MDDLTKPLIKAGAAYMGELIRCILLGLLLCALALAFVVFGLPDEVAQSRRTLILVVSVVLCAGLFPVLYGVIGHQRGLARAINSLADSHGEALFDHTLGRFVTSIESRNPGALAQAASSPEKLAQSITSWLAQADFKPKLLRRIGSHYVGKLGAKVSQGGGLPAGLVTDQTFNVPVFKAWSLEQARELFEPGWTFFMIVLGVQIVAIGLLRWWAP